MVVRQSGMHCGQRQVVLLGHLGSISTLLLVPDDDVLNRDPVSRNARLPTRDAGRQHDVSTRYGRGAR